MWIYGKGDILKKLLIMFPGVGYGFNHPLLYYADSVFEEKGYERKYMKYQEIFLDRELTFEEKADKVREYVEEQANQIDFSMYEEIIFLSKSVGSLEAGALAEKLGIKIKQIFLTPIEQAISYCKDGSYVVMGTNDEAYLAYKEHCEKNEIKVLYIENANHSLEIQGQPYENIEILKKVMEFIGETK